MAKRKIIRKRGRRIVRIFPDSSFLISHLNPKDSHHDHTESCLGLLRPLKPIFYFSTLVVMETMSGLIRNNFTTKKAFLKLTNFLRESDNSRTETPIRLEAVLKRFRDFAKSRKINKLTTIDFYIVTEAMTQHAKLLTTDKRMYKTSKQKYRETYLISDKVRGLKSDLPRLTRDVVENLKII
jgi:predicted nucleic acid-binding protein